MAVILLGTGAAMAGTSEGQGVLKEVTTRGAVTVFEWVQASGGEAVPFAIVLDQANADFDRTVIACAPFQRGILLNKIAISKSDRVVLLFTKGKTTTDNINWVRKLLSREQAIDYDFAII